jgi:cystine transport system permease protein
MSERLAGILIDSFTKILVPGLMYTIPLTAISFALALVIAVFMALVQFMNIRGLKQFARFYIWVIRGTPLLVQLYVVFYGLGQLGLLLPPFLAGIIALSVNEGAYCAETVRAALESVPKGQMEACECVGMSYLQTMRRIVLPQAMATILPALCNEGIAVLKETSIVGLIAVVDLTRASDLVRSRTLSPYFPMISVAIVYFVLVFGLSKLVGRLEKRLSRGR